MPRFLSVFSILILAISCSTAQGVLITYKLIDEAAGDQDGHLLSGTITLDPDTCASTCTSIDSWEYTISGPTLNRTATSAAIGELLDNPNGLFAATSTELTINFNSVINEGLILDLYGLAWTTDHLIGPTYGAYDPIGSTSAWDSVPPSGVVTIATAVPEPSAFFCLGLILISYVAWSRMNDPIPKCPSANIPTTSNYLRPPSNPDLIKK